MELKISNEWIRKVTETPWHKTQEDYKSAIPFAVDVGQARQLNQWYIEHEKTCPHAGVDGNGMPMGGAIGGALTFTFTPTGLGTVTRVVCACGGKVDLTEYGEW